MREGVSASLLANFAWIVVNVAVFVPFIMAAAPPFRFGGLFGSGRTPRSSAQVPALVPAHSGQPVKKVKGFGNVAK